MLEYLFSSKTKEQILFFLSARNEGYAREIAKYYNRTLSSVQNQLTKLEYGNIVVSQNSGKTVVFKMNPRYTFYNELSALIRKAITFLPEKEKDKLLNIRKRPRRRGKEL